jgi:hypothetical protein
MYILYDFNCHMLCPENIHPSWYRIFGIGISYVLIDILHQCTIQI